MREEYDIAELNPRKNPYANRVIHTTISEFTKSGLPFSKELGAFLAANDLETIPLGRHMLDGGAYVSISEYVTKENPKFEAHRKWIDIQLIVTGRERILVAPIEKGLPLTDYDEEKDVRFYDCAEQVETIDLVPGQLVALFPEDLHAPGNSVFGPSHVRKAVVKVPVELWKR